MEIAACFSTLTHRDLPFVEYAWEFCTITAKTALDDATLNSVLDRGQLLSPRGPPRHHRTELEGRDPGCLESVQPRSRTIPLAIPRSSLPAATDSSPRVRSRVGSPPPEYSPEWAPVPESSPQSRVWIFPKYILGGAIKATIAHETACPAMAPLAPCSAMVSRVRGSLQEISILQRFVFKAVKTDSFSFPHCIVTSTTSG